MDSLLRLAADATGAPKGQRGAALLLACDGRLLRDGGATLAAAGVTGGSRIEVVWSVHGGMLAGTMAWPGERSVYRSITRSNLMALLKSAEALLRRGGFSGPITSHALQGLFQNVKKGKDAYGKTVLERYPKNVVAGPFHPQVMWGRLYSNELPTAIITYTW